MASCSDLQREWHHAAGTLYEPRNAVLVFKVSSPDSELPSYYRRCCYHVVHPFSPLNSQKGYNLSMSATTLFRIICFELMWDNMFCSERVNKIGTPLPVAFDYPPPPPLAIRIHTIKIDGHQIYVEVLLLFAEKCIWIFFVVFRLYW